MSDTPRTDAEAFWVSESIVSGNPAAPHHVENISLQVVSADLARALECELYKAQGFTPISSPPKVVAVTRGHDGDDGRELKLRFDRDLQDCEAAEIVKAINTAKEP